jgi:hypothetical protein
LRSYDGAAFVAVGGKILQVVSTTVKTDNPLARVLQQGTFFFEQVTGLRSNNHAQLDFVKNFGLRFCNWLRRGLNGTAGFRVDA